MRRLVLVLLLLILVGFILNVALYHYSRGYGKFLVINEDDAYISMRYAQNLIQGHGLTWNVDEQPVEGYTCFLWVLLLALAGKLGGDMVLWSKILGTAFAIAGITSAYCIANELESGNRRHLAGLVTALLLAFNPGYIYWAGSGMESSLFACLLLLGLLLYVKEGTSNARYVALSIILALATLTRPEGLFFFTLIVSHLLLWHLAHRKRPPATVLACLLVPFLLVFIPYYAWRFGYYGYVFPNTFYAKTGGHSSGMSGGIQYLLHFLRDTPWIICLPFSLIFFARQKFNILFICISLAMYTLYVVAVGGDWMPGYRFFIPILPWLAVCFGLLISKFHDRVLAGQKRLPVRFAAACAMYPIILYFNSRALYTSAYRTSESIKQLNSRFVAIGRYLRDNYPPSAGAAIFPAGAISYYSGLKIIDMYGLSDVHIAHLEKPNFGDLAINGSSVPPVTGAAGHCKTDIPYVLARRPTLLIGQPDLTSSPDMPSNWNVEKIFKSYPRSEYELVVDRLTSPGDPFFDRGIFFRYLRLKSAPETSRFRPGIHGAE